MTADQERQKNEEQRPTKVEVMCPGCMVTLDVERVAGKWGVRLHVECPLCHHEFEVSL